MATTKKTTPTPTRKRVGNKPQEAKEGTAPDTQGTLEIGAAEVKESYDELDGLSLADKRKFAKYALTDTDLDIDKANQAALLKAFQDEEGVDDTFYENIYMQDEAGGKAPEVNEPENSEPEEPEEEENTDEPAGPEENKLLVLMTRPNGTYEILGYRFTQQHPYHLIPESVAEHILEHVDGFRQGRPSEVADYYN